ncbi:MAG: DUF2970 domain-containing protein [Nitrosomonas sp.]
MTDKKDSDQKQQSVDFWRIAKAVMFSFMGIRKKSDLESDAELLTPVQVIIGGIIGAALFVLGVMVVVRLVVS